MRIRRVGVMLLSLGLAPAAIAQVGLSVQDAVDRALQGHPKLAVDAARIQAAEGGAQQASLRPNPRVYIQSENWNVSGAPPQPIASTFTDQFLYASQVLETGGKRQRRIELANSAISAATQDRAVTAFEIASRVKFTYWAAAGVERVVELLRENQQNLEQTVSYHEIQVREGALPEGDLVRVQLEADRAMVNLESAVRDAEVAKIALLREMGETDFGAVVLTDRLEAAGGPPLADIEAAMATRPDLVRARRAVEQSRANLRLQQSLAKPDVEVLSGYKRTVGFNTFMWGVQFNLPFSNKNQGNIAAAGSEIRAAESVVAVAEAAARAEIAAALRDATARQQRLRDLMAGSLARADEVVQIARAAYREGGTDLLRLLDAERTHIDLEVLNARLQMEYRQSLVNLETALGGNP